MCARARTARQVSITRVHEDIATVVDAGDGVRAAMDGVRECVLTHCAAMSIGADEGAGGTGRRDDGAWQRSHARILWSAGSYNCAGGRIVIGCQDGTHAADLLQGSCCSGPAVHTSRTHRCLSPGWDAGRVWGHTDNAAGVTLQGRMAAIVLGNTGDAQKLL